MTLTKANQKEPTESKIHQLYESWDTTQKAPVEQEKSMDAVHIDENIFDCEYYLSIPRCLPPLSVTQRPFRETNFAVRLHSKTLDLAGDTAGLVFIFGLDLKTSS